MSFNQVLQARKLADEEVNGTLPANLFNSAIAAFSIVALSEVLVLDEIKSAGVLHIDSYAKEKNLNTPALKSLIDVAIGEGIIKSSPDGDTVTPGPEFSSIYRTKGFFTWLLGGCGELLRTSGTVIRNEFRTNGFINRDARMIGAGTGDFGAQFIDSEFDEFIEQQELSCVADLGCGSGERLIRILQANPEARGVGIDSAAGAVELARERLKESGLADRATVIQADVHEMPGRPEFREVDFVTSFLMGHDFWPRERCLRMFDLIRESFPGLRSFVMCDTYKSGVIPSSEIPLLTLGFEHVHALMGQSIPTLDDWRSVFKEARWSVDKEIDLVLPPFTKIFQLVPE